MSDDPVIVEIIETGERAYVTWEDQFSVRVTPVDGHPMTSLFYKHDEVKRLDE